jgi:hypothetical protein
MAFGAGLLGIWGTSEVLQACTQAPPNPPVWIQSGPVTPEGQIFWVIFHDYTTFGAQQGQFCACGLALLGQVQGVQILGVELRRADNQQPIPGFGFQPSVAVGPSFNEVLAANWQGFLAPITQNVPPGIACNLHFEILVPVPFGFKRGDANCDGCVDEDDAVFIQNFLFKAGPAPCCLDAADANDNGRLDITDATLILNFVGLGGPPPAPPGPFTCGIDPTPVLGCASYPQNLCSVQCLANGGQGGGAGVPGLAQLLLDDLAGGAVGTAEGRMDGSVVMDNHLVVIPGNEFGPMMIAPPAPTVPASTTWGLIAMAGVLGAAGLFTLDRRRSKAPRS